MSLTKTTLTPTKMWSINAKVKCRAKLIKFVVVYLYSAIVMNYGSDSKSIIKRCNVIEEWKMSNLMVVENYVRHTTFTFIIIVTITNIITITLYKLWICHIYCYLYLYHYCYRYDQAVTVIVKVTINCGICDFR